MAISVYLWLEDNSGRRSKGSVDVKDREGSIEVIEFMHSIEQPIDKFSGKITTNGKSSLHPDDSSEGCIIAPLSARRSIWKSNDTVLVAK
ncbi:type VI secretion system tube protein Hcp [Enterobacter asburiae]|uniref:type VI secretion system tube protein Hcp n=1 Tax=Enterobacter asburiae TaxID=61645 RepID=UPI0011D1EC80|nr:type VI secretion system tube protein Hcp [Enterobacter asburiae]